MAKQRLCPVYEEVHAKEIADALKGMPPVIVHENVCCCLCVHHCVLSSHPWVNNQTGRLGWVCIINADGHKHAMLCNEHFVGGCEMYRYDDRKDK